MKRCRTDSNINSLVSRWDVLDKMIEDHIQHVCSHSTKYKYDILRSQYDEIGQLMNRFVDELHNTKSEWPLTNLKIYNAISKWFGKTIQVDGKEFFIDDDKIEFNLRYLAPMIMDNMQWYYITNNALGQGCHEVLYMNEDATCYKVKLEG